MAEIGWLLVLIPDGARGAGVAKEGCGMIVALGVCGGVRCGRFMNRPRRGFLV